MQRASPNHFGVSETSRQLRRRAWWFLGIAILSVCTVVYILSTGGMRRPALPILMAGQAAAYLVIMFINFRRSRKTLLRERRAAGDCIACGYNLTGNASGVCPECGVHMKSDRA